MDVICDCHLFPEFLNHSSDNMMIGMTQQGLLYLSARWAIYKEILGKRYQMKVIKGYQNRLLEDESGLERHKLLSLLELFCATVAIT